MENLQEPKNLYSTGSPCFLVSLSTKRNISPARRNITAATRQMPHCCAVRDSVSKTFCNSGISVTRSKMSIIQPYATHNLRLEKVSALNMVSVGCRRPSEIGMAMMENMTMAMVWAAVIEPDVVMVHW